MEIQLDIYNLNSFNDIKDNEMLKIAQELKGYVNEVGYISKVDTSTYKLRYFSSEREVEFCGHVTIAIMYDIVKNNNGLINEAEVNIITNKGKLVVQNRIEDEDDVFIKI